MSMCLWRALSLNDAPRPLKIGSGFDCRPTFAVIVAYCRIERAAAAEANLKRLSDAIESGIADVSDPRLKERVTGRKSSALKCQLCKEMARPKRFELLTPRFVVWCSIQLSYGRVFRLALGFK